MDEESFSYINRLSFLWFTSIGWICAIILGLIMSFITNALSKTSQKPSDPRLFTPFVAARIRRRNEKNPPTNGSQVFVLDTKSFERVGS